MKAVVALFFLVISVVSFASNPDEILQPPTAFDVDPREASQIPTPQPLPHEGNQDGNEDHLIEAGDERDRDLRREEDERKSALDRSAERLDDQKHEMWDEDRRVAKPHQPSHVPPQRHTQPPVDHKDPYHPQPRHSAE